MYSIIQWGVKRALSTGCPNERKQAIDYSIDNKSCPGVSPGCGFVVELHIKMLEQAFKEHVIPINVADVVVLPKNPRNKIKTLDKEGVAVFLKEFKTSRYCTAFLLTLTTGFDYNKQKVQLKGGLVSRFDQNQGEIQYSFEFNNIYIFRMTELDISYVTLDDGDYILSLFEVVESDDINNAKDIRGVDLRHIIVKTYDDVFEILCKEYNLNFSNKE